jgi:hypothetical protein
MTTPMPADENTRHRSDPTVLAVNPAHAEILRPLLRFGIMDTCSNRKAAAYESMLRKLDPAHAPPIRGVLNVSTRHLRPEDRRFLDNASSPRTIQGTAAMKGVFGWLVYAHHERDLQRGLGHALDDHGARPRPRLRLRPLRSGRGAASAAPRLRRGDRRAHHLNQRDRRSDSRRGIGRRRPTPSP